MVRPYVITAARETATPNSVDGRPPGLLQLMPRLILGACLKPMKSSLSATTDPTDSYYEGKFKQSIPLISTARKLLPLGQSGQSHTDRALLALLRAECPPLFEALEKGIHPAEVQHLA